MSFSRLLVTLGSLCLLTGTAVAADAPTIAIDVDARELPRKLVHTTLDIPCQPGTLRMWYPKWFPGSHGPHGRVEDVAGFRVETTEGAAVPQPLPTVTIADTNVVFAGTASVTTTFAASLGPLLLTTSV